MKMLQPMPATRPLAQAALALLLCAAAGWGWVRPASAQATGPAAASPQASPNAACPRLLRHTHDRLQDEKPQSLCQYAGQVVVVVNTASFCGFTPQYKGLEDLYARYKGRGLVVLGFPSNDFSQEPESKKKIADFCESTFGVKFPMFAPSSVTGAKANPVFSELARQSRAPSWNFNKYLVSPEGKVVAYFGSSVTPESKELNAAIEKAL